MKTHPFFRRVDWEAVESRKLLSPFKIRLQDEADTSMFNPAFLNQEVTEVLTLSAQPKSEKTDFFPAFEFNRTAENKKRKFKTILSVETEEGCDSGPSV